MLLTAIKTHYSGEFFCGKHETQNPSLASIFITSIPEKKSHESQDILTCRPAMSIYFGILATYLIARNINPL